MISFLDMCDPEFCESLASERLNIGRKWNLDFGYGR